MKRKIATALGAYTLIAFLIFGWVYNHTELCFHGPHPETGVVGDWCYSEQWRVNTSGMFGALWIVVIPVIAGTIVLIGAWHGVTQAAIYVTRWP